MTKTFKEVRILSKLHHFYINNKRRRVQVAKKAGHRVQEVSKKGKGQSGNVSPGLAVLAGVKQSPSAGVTESI